MSTTLYAPNHLTENAIAEFEVVIRDLAATVIAEADNRIHHPSYGYTKTMIRNSAQRLDGAIGVYMVLTGQAAHTKATGVVTFHGPRHSETADVVNRARDAVGAL